MTASDRLFGLDTNILVYAIDAGGGDRGNRAEMIVRRAVATRRCILSLQTIGEFYFVCTRKRKASSDAAARRADDYSRLFAVTEPALDDARTALREAASGRLSYWDALLVTTLGRSGCAILLSEDMQDGAKLAGVTIRNPFVGNQLPSDLAVLLS